MNPILLLLLVPMIVAILVFVVRHETARNVIARIGALTIVGLSIFVFAGYFNSDVVLNLPDKELINKVILAAEVVIAGYILFKGLKFKKYLVCVFAVAQTLLMLWFELFSNVRVGETDSILLDKFSGIMVLIIGIVGGLICLYSVGYMKWYHGKHPEYKERKSFFIAILFFFLSAMFGIVLSNDLTYMLFCWELTTLCSFLLIGYTQTEEATNNAFRALVINLGGGVCFAVANVFLAFNYGTLSLQQLISIKPETSVMVLIPVFLLSIAALTKSAQFPFSSWLLGAMVAPTPSSALLHSATMVKAGVFLLIRLAPLLGNTPVGKAVTLVGAITFLIMSIMAISQNDAKKILAFSTIANLGLIVTCASINTPESIWAAILLIIFHAVAKSLLFLSVGSTEHQIGSRDVENMDVLLHVSRRLSLYMLIGIAGMFLAPFGMLISKWVAMKAFIDSKNIFIVIILVYGSAATLFYWTKWMGKLTSNASTKKKEKHTFFADEEITIFIHAALTVLACFGFPIISSQVIVPYLSSVYGAGIAAPIQSGDVALMLIMLSMLIILPISFIPLYKHDKRRRVPIYMAGENTGDNETFNASLGKTQKVQLRNWYVKNLFGKKELQYYGNIFAIGSMATALVIVIWGVLG